MALIQFGFEKLAEVMREPGVTGLVESHFLEISEDQDELPFHPDWGLFLRQEEAGHLLMYVARDGRQVVGFQLFLIHADPSTCTMGAWDYPYYLNPEYRATGAGLRSTGVSLLFGAEEELRKRGVRRITRHIKVKPFAGRGGLMRLFARAGYRPFEIRLSKVLAP